MITFKPFREQFSVVVGMSTKKEMFNNYVVSQRERERERNTQDMYTVESQMEERQLHIMG